MRFASLLIAALSTLLSKVYISDSNSHRSPESLPHSPSIIRVVQRNETSMGNRDSKEGYKSLREDEVKKASVVALTATKTTTTVSATAPVTPGTSKIEVKRPALELKVGDIVTMHWKYDSALERLIEVEVTKAGCKGDGTVELNLNPRLTLRGIREIWLNESLNDKEKFAAKHLCVHQSVFTRDNYHSAIQQLLNAPKATTTDIEIKINDQLVVATQKFKDYLLEIHSQLNLGDRDAFDIIQQYYDEYNAIGLDSLILSGRTVADEIYTVSNVNVRYSMRSITPRGKWMKGLVDKISITKMEVMR